MNTPKVHTVCVVGAAADVSARIVQLLDEQRAKLSSRWRAGDHASADLLIIDADSLYGHMDWLKANSSGRRVAAFTHSPDAHDSEFALRHAFIAADVVALLNRVSRQMDGASKPGAPAAAAKPVQPASAVAPELVNITTDTVALVTPARPRSTLQAVTKGVSPSAPPAGTRPTVIAPPVLRETPHVQAAPAAPVVEQTPRVIRLLDLLENDSPIKGRLHLRAEGLPSLLLDPTERTWFSPSGLKGLAAWATRAIGVDEAQHPDAKDFIIEIASLQGHPYARLQWLAHLVRHEGELNASLDEQARFKLSRWPQSEREFPRHFRIATVMLKQSATLAEIAELAGASVADVANFINAYHALGYIEQESAERAPEAGSRGGLFGRMLRTSANIS